MTTPSDPDPLLDTLSDPQRLEKNQRLATAEFRARGATGNAEKSVNRRLPIMWLGSAACAALIAVAFVALPKEQTSEAPQVSSAELQPTQGSMRAPAGVSLERRIETNGLVIPVSDLRQAIRFYQDQLGFVANTGSEAQTSASLQRGDLNIVLLEQTINVSTQRPIQAELNDLAKVAQALDTSGIAYEWEQRSLQFQDPDGNLWKISQAE